MKDPLTLLDVIHAAFSRPEYQPGGGLTHCNQFVSEVAAAYGFKGLDGILANDVIDLLSTHQDWSVMSFDRAQDAANDGSLVIAGLKAAPHGHVCVICPGRAKTSGRWGPVPSVANVGAKNFIGAGINWAFSDLPKLWVLRSSI